MKDYTKLRELLDAQETFPLDFKFKFIGRNSPAFSASVTRWESLHPSLKLEQSRESSGGNHLALTYQFDAPDVASIIEIYHSIETLDDLMVLL